jgi:hypothetical protein
MVTCFNSLRINTGRILRLLVVSIILIASVCISEAFGQAAATPSRASAGDAENHGQTYAPLGDSGYRVPLHEIKLNEILGGQPSKPKPKPPEAEKSAAPELETVGPTEESRPRQPAKQETSAAPEHPRLPFNHPTPKRGPTASPEKSSAEEHPAAPPPPKERTFPLTAPAAPEDLMVARPPKKEVIGKRTPPGAPPLLEAQPSKETLSTIPLKAQETPRSGPVEGIPLGTRGEPETVPRKKLEPEPAPPASTGPQPELGPAPKEKTSSAPSVKSESDKSAAREGTPIPSLQAQESEPEKSPPKEVAPSALPVAPAHEQSSAKESLPSFNRPVPSPKEALKSPLDEETPDTPEIKYYLRDTTPILEELSLLMTRAPSISIADYDPSDPNAPLFPRDIQLKMDSMKRELQVLDSKTFAIIPPKKYEQFHGLIRDSISQTHQACDAILNYLAEPNEENFKTIQDHLLRARELIQKTRSHG